MHYRIRYMYVKYHLNRDKRFIKIVNTKKYIKLHKFATRNTNFKKNRSSQTCIARPSIFRPNLKPICMLVIVQPRSKDISTDDGQTDRQTDGRTDIASDDIRYFFSVTKKLLKSKHEPIQILNIQNYTKKYNDYKCI